LGHLLQHVDIVNFRRHCFNIKVFLAKGSVQRRLPQVEFSATLHVKVLTQSL
jgi:hypothetical protein